MTNATNALITMTAKQSHMHTRTHTCKRAEKQSNKYNGNIYYLHIYNAKNAEACEKGKIHTTMRTCKNA